MFNYVVEVKDGKIKTTYDFENDYIKAVLFASKCKIKGLDAVVITKTIY